MTAAETRLSSLDRLLDDGTVDAGYSAELFAVVDSLTSSVSLRRALTDPGTPEQARAGLAHGLFDSRVSGPVADLLATAVTQRWAGGRTFAAALERQAVRAQLIAAERAGQLDEVEDELFRFARTVESSPELRSALGDRSMPLANRQELVGELLAGRATEATVALAKRAVAARERTFGHTIESYVDLAAAHKNRVIATVRVARALSAEQRDRLRAALNAQVGRDVVLQEIVDPSVLGGVRVELGDEVIEGTVADRLHEARRLFS